MIVCEKCKITIQYNCTFSNRKFEHVDRKLFCNGRPIVDRQKDWGIRKPDQREWPQTVLYVLPNQ